MRRRNRRVTWDVAVVVVVIGVMVTGSRGAYDVVMMRMRMVMQWCCLSIVS